MRIESQSIFKNMEPKIKQIAYGIFNPSNIKKPHQK